MISRRTFLALALGLLAAGSAVLTPAAARAQAPDPAGGSVLDQLTPAESSAAGLQKLSPKERASLDAALNRYLGVAVKKSTDQAVARQVIVQATVIESRVAGVFHGLTGRTRITLENGQVWRQDNNTDRFVANIDHPDVIVLRTGLGYVMRVGGVNGRFYVSQVSIH